MIRPGACSACPYRRDCPPGIWAAEEYAKLPPYDAETHAQPTEAFACHAAPEQLCHGWAVVGGWDLLALRIRAALSGKEIQIPEPSGPLFSSGAEAASHGLAGIEEPPADALAAIARLQRTYPRLR